MPYRYDNRIFPSLESICDEVIGQHGMTPFDLLIKDPTTFGDPANVIVQWPALDEKSQSIQLAQTLLPDVKAWWSEHHLPVTDDDLLSDLEAAVRNTEDGYDRAHWLHHCRGWTPNTKLVTILDC